MAEICAELLRRNRNRREKRHESILKDYFCNLKSIS